MSTRVLANSSYTSVREMPMLRTVIETTKSLHYICLSGTLIENIGIKTTGGSLTYFHHTKAVCIPADTCSCRTVCHRAWCPHNGHCRFVYSHVRTGRHHTLEIINFV